MMTTEMHDEFANNEAKGIVLTSNFKPTIEEEIAVESLLDSLYAEFVISKNCEAHGAAWAA